MKKLSMVVAATAVLALGGMAQATDELDNLVASSLSTVVYTPIAGDIADAGSWAPISEVLDLNGEDINGGALYIEVCSGASSKPWTSALKLSGEAMPVE